MLAPRRTNGGNGGQGRVKILNSGDRSITGTINGVGTDGLCHR